MIIVAYVLLAILLGAAVSLQGTFNAGLARETSLPQALVINTSIVLTGAVVVFLLAPSGRTFHSLAEIEPQYFLGGLCGLFIIAVAAWIFPRLGVGYAIALAMLGQLVAGLVIDHNGWFGIPKTPISTARIVGMALLLAGAWLLKR
jgi:transporter family-2 protein